LAPRGESKFIADLAALPVPSAHPGRLRSQLLRGGQCPGVLAWLTREAARKLGPDYDAEIVELHHAAKRDAPSGTALRLGEAVAEGRAQKLSDHLVLERAGDIGARPEGAIGIQTLRGGDHPGEHTVLFAGRGEHLELVHRSHTRDHFARGALRAALWLLGRPAGLYRVEEALGLD
jgi:4-hydroxy-tetrahydrodipicolinate reductase